MIEEDAFRFETLVHTGRAEWVLTLPFSKISDLEYKPTGGRVSGILQDGTEFVFRIDQELASEEAMRVVESLFHPETGTDVESVDVTAPGNGGPARWPQSVEAAFADAAQCDVEPQVRRFARLTANTGLEMDWSRNQRRLNANLPGTKNTAFALYWTAKGRLNMGVYRTGGFGVGEAEALGKLPKIRAFHPMDSQETDRFLDALEVFLAAHPLKESAAPTRVTETVEAPPEPTPRPLLVRSTQILSDDEIAEALRPLEKRFEEAARYYGVESQARRFAELTAAADLKVRWNGRGLDAAWRRTGRTLYYLDWDRRGWAKGGFGEHREGLEFGMYTVVHADEVDWDINYRASKVDASPKMGYTRKMDADEINHNTDLFLDWLQEFLATHSIPSREAEAVWKTEYRLSNRGFGPLLLVLGSIIWIGIVTFLLTLLPWKIPLPEPVGAAVWILLFLVVPVAAIVSGVTGRREIRDYNREHPDARQIDTWMMWADIVVGGFFVVFIVSMFLLKLANPYP